LQRSADGFARQAAAQVIGVLQSAETMDRGTYKPMVAIIHSCLTFKLRNII
jgi:hypothetical protein